MHIRAFPVLTGDLSEKKLTVFCSPKRCSYKPAISYKLIDRQYCYCGFMRLAKCYIGWVTDTLIWLMRFFGNGDIHNFSILRKVLISHQNIFSCNLRRKPNYIDNIFLHNSNRSQLWEIHKSWLGMRLFKLKKADMTLYWVGRDPTSVWWYGVIPEVIIYLLRIRGIAPARHPIVFHSVTHRAFKRRIGLNIWLSGNEWVLAALMKVPLRI